MPDGDVLTRDLANVQTNELGLESINPGQRGSVELDEERIQDVASILLGAHKSGVIVKGPLQGHSARIVQRFIGKSEVGLVFGTDRVSARAVGFVDSIHCEILDPRLENISGDKTRGFEHVTLCAIRQHNLEDVAKATVVAHLLIHLQAGDELI